MRISLCCAAMLAASPAAARAEQPPAQVAPGAKVQVFAPKGVLGYTDNREARRSIFGTVEAITSGQLTIHDGKASRTVPMRDISRLKAVNGKRRNVLGGAVVGALFAGVVVPILMVTTATCPCEGRGSDGSALPFIALPVAGAMVGGGIGALVKSDRWERVPLPLVTTAGHGRVRLAVHAVRRGAAVGVALAF